MVNDAGDDLNVENPVELARRYESLAGEAKDDSKKVILFKKAAAMHHELGSYLEEARCLSLACGLLAGEDKVECLVLCWGVYINAIAIYQFEVGFEWKGEEENLDSSYMETIGRFYDGAIDALEKALKTAGVERERLLERLYAECVKRKQEGGWGESECFSSIDRVFKVKRTHFAES
jgi:hypothetical protein